MQCEKIRCNDSQPKVYGIVLMEDILHRLVGSLFTVLSVFILLCAGIYTSRLVIAEFPLSTAVLKVFLTDRGFDKDSRSNGRLDGQHIIPSSFNNVNNFPATEFVPDLPIKQ